MAKRSLGLILGAIAVGIGGYVFLKTRPAKAASGIELPPNVTIVNGMLQAGVAYSKLSGARYIGIVTDKTHRAMIERIVAEHAERKPDVEYMIISAELAHDLAAKFGGNAPPEGVWGGVTVMDGKTVIMHRYFEADHGEEFAENALTTADDPDMLEGIVPGGNVLEGFVAQG